MLRLGGSLLQGRVPATGIMRTQRVGDNLTRLAQGVVEFGRIDKTLHALDRGRLAQCCASFSAVNGANCGSVIARAGRSSRRARARRQYDRCSGIQFAWRHRSGFPGFPSICYSNPTRSSPLFAPSVRDARRLRITTGVFPVAAAFREARYLAQGRGLWKIQSNFDCERRFHYLRVHCPNVLMLVPSCRYKGGQIERT